MLEIDFSAWLKNNNTSKKVASDYISRIKKFEHSIKNCDIDEEYRKDRCSEILELFYKSGQNEKMANLHYGNLPIGKYYLSTYKLAIKKYITFMDWYTSTNPVLK